MKWPGGEVVTLRFAKPTRTGSIPVLASTQNFLASSAFFRFVSTTTQTATFQVETFEKILSPSRSIVSNVHNATGGLFRNELEPWCVLP